MKKREDGDRGRQGATLCKGMEMIKSMETSWLESKALGAREWGEGFIRAWNISWIWSWS